MLANDTTMQLIFATVATAATAATARHANAPDTQPAHVCLGCGAPMLEVGCKIRCRSCGYFEDCGNGLTPPPVSIPGGPPGGPSGNVSAPPDR